MNSKTWEMVDFIKDNGIKKQGKEMEQEYSFGLMEASMKEFGEMTELMVKGE